MLGMPMEEALNLLRVPAEVEEALLHGTGKLGNLLNLAQACESSNDAAFDRAANVLQLSSAQINGAHLQALVWADHVAD